MLAFAKGPQSSTCGQHQGLPCGGTAWVSARGPCCFPTDDPTRSWGLPRSCSGTWFPTEAHLTLSCKGEHSRGHQRASGKGWGGSHQLSLARPRRGQGSLLGTSVSSWFNEGLAWLTCQGLPLTCCPGGKEPGLSELEEAAPPQAQRVSRDVYCTCQRMESPAGGHQHPPQTPPPRPMCQAGLWKGWKGTEQDRPSSHAGTLSLWQSQEEHPGPNPQSGSALAPPQPPGSF